MRLVAAVALVATAASCHRSEKVPFLGYVEGDYLYIAAPLAGRVESVAVEKGSTVEAGTRLFSLERTAEEASLAEAEHRLVQAHSRLADARKGMRPTELAAAEARLAQARSLAELSAGDLGRAKPLHDSGVLAADAFDRARFTHLRDEQAVAQLEADLATAKLGARSDSIAAAEADVAAVEAARNRAAWAVDQKQVAAPAAALVFDILFRPGEFVPAGQPVVSLLPPDNVKVRFYVPEGQVAALRQTQTVQVAISGRGKPLTAQINYISPQAEFTPPVIYSRENRAKLVFLVEARPSAADAATLHPGQPVEVIPAQVDADAPPMPLPRKR
jgi:HlyD family secretion protein